MKEYTQAYVWFAQGVSGQYVCSVVNGVKFARCIKLLPLEISRNLAIETSLVEHIGDRGRHVIGARLRRNYLFT